MAIQRRPLLFLLIIVLIAVIAIPASAQNWPNPGIGSTYTELANKTADSATVLLSYYDTQGALHDGPKQTIPGNGSMVIDPEKLTVLPEFAGISSYASDQPLAAVVKTLWKEGPGDGLQMGLYSGVSAPSSKLCFPSLWKMEGRILSRFVVQNTDSIPVILSIAYKNRDGADAGIFSDTLVAGTEKTYDLARPGDAIPDLPNDWEGSAIVSTNGSSSLAGVAIVSYGSEDTRRARSAAYNAVDCAGRSGLTTLQAPTQFRVKRTDGNWAMWSALNIQNIENIDASVTIRYTPRQASKPGLVLNETLPANATLGLNTRTGGNEDAGAFEPLGDNWDGSVTITSDRAIAATGITQWDRNGYVESGIYETIDDLAFHTTFFAPDIKRIKDHETWREWSAVIVQNMGSKPADVTILFYDRLGEEKLRLDHEQIAPSAAMGYNLRNGGSKSPAAFDPLGDDFEGHAVVIGNNDQPLGVVLNHILRPSDDPFQGASGATNALPQ